MPLLKFCLKKGETMSKISDEVQKFIEPIVSKLGFEIVEVDFSKKHDGDNLTVFIDKRGGVTIDDCEAVHNAIDEPLDELNPTADKPYILNVSSPGLDRPIITNRDYERVIGEVLEVKLYKPISRKKVFVGTLKSYSDEVIVLEANGKETEILRSLISKATKYIDF